MTKARRFLFRQFEIIHQQSAMKVGTDGVLLGSWINVDNAERILDIGTGSGLIALMAAQKNKTALIDAIDIESSAVEEAKLNILASPWSERIEAYCESIRHFNPTYLYDHIVSNPPFFGAGSISPVENRKIARHTTSLGFEELMYHSSRLMNPLGELSIIVPATEYDNLVQLGLANGLYLIRQSLFISKPNKEPHRHLLCFSKREKACERDSIVHYNEDNTWSASYKKLTKEFYIK